MSEAENIPWAYSLRDFWVRYSQVKGKLKHLTVLEKSGENSVIVFNFRLLVRVSIKIFSIKALSFPTPTLFCLQLILLCFTNKMLELVVFLKFSWFVDPPICYVKPCLCIRTTKQIYHFRSQNVGVVIKNNQCICWNSSVQSPWSIWNIMWRLAGQSNYFLKTIFPAPLIAVTMFQYILSIYKQSIR